MTRDRPTTILQVLPALDTGGVERSTIEMVQAIVASGGHALVASAGGRLVPHVERAGGKHVTLSLMTKDPLNIWLNAGRLSRIIRDEGVDVVHARSRAPGWSAWMAARRSGVPFVTTWHGVYGEDFWGKKRFNSVMGKGDRVIAASVYIAERMMGSYRVNPARIRVIPRGVDPASFDPTVVGGDRVHKLAQAWRLQAGARVVMLPARITRWKGAEALIDALGLLAARDVYCILVGSDQGREAFSRSLAKRAERYGMLEMLRMVGHCEDMPAALRLADVVVCTSLRPEPFGRSVIEAQAMRRPVVAFNHGGAGETVVDELTGFLVPPGDVAALSAAIGRALALPDEARDCLGWRARHSVLNSYTTALMQQATLDVYAEVLKTEVAFSKDLRMALHAAAAHAR
jgi:glycosyltransferase involved in cell wall biosynthesis